MTIKKQSNKLGKLIRKLTGMPFVTAMKIAKVVIREGDWNASEKFPNEVERRARDCSCCTDFFVLKGKTIEEVRSISIDSLQREIDIMEFFKKNPGKTYVAPRTKK